MTITLHVDPVINLLIEKIIQEDGERADMLMTAAGAYARDRGYVGTSFPGTDTIYPKVEGGHGGPYGQ